MSRQPLKWESVGRDENTVLKLPAWSPTDVGKVMRQDGPHRRGVEVGHHLGARQHEGAHQLIRSTILEED